MIPYRLFFLFFPFFIWGQQSWQTHQQGISIQVSYPSKSLDFQEEFVLTLILKYPNIYQPLEENLISNLTGNWNPFTTQWMVVDQQVSTHSDSLIEKIYTFKLRPLIDGSLFLTFLTISFQNTASNEQIDLFTPIFKIDVGPNRWNEIIDQLVPASPFPFTPQYRLSLSASNQDRLLGHEANRQEAKRNEQLINRHRFPWIRLALILIGVIIWVAWKPINQFLKPFWTPKTPPMQAKEEAWQKLDHLQQKQFIQDHLDKKYYDRLTAILKAYLEKEWKLPLTSKTSVETSFILNQSSLPRPIQTTTQEIFDLADQVKFANYKPSNEEGKLIYEKARQIIQYE